MFRILETELSSEKDPPSDEELANRLLLWGNSFFKKDSKQSRSNGGKAASNCREGEFAPQLFRREGKQGKNVSEVSMHMFYFAEHSEFARFHCL